MRALLLAAAIAAAGCAPTSAVTPSARPTPEPGTLTVAALLDLSGTRAAIGSAQRDALTLWTDRPPATRVRMILRVIDTASSDARLLIELRRAVVDDGARAVIVGTPVVYDDTVGSAVGLSAVPVLFTTPIAEPVARPGGKWAFALAPTPEQIAAVPVRSGTAVIRTLPYLTTPAEIAQLRDPALVAWPGSRSLATTAADRFGTTSTVALSAYDALTILVMAGPGGIEQGAVAGVATTYTFTATKHAGFATADLALLGWDGRRIILK